MSKFVKDLITKDLRNRLEGVEDALLVEVGDPRGDNPELVRALVEAGARIVHLTEEAISLEQVYLDLVGETGERDADGSGAVA